LLLDEVVERVIIQDTIQALVKRVPAGGRQFIRGDPQPRRAGAVLATTQAMPAV
jgi:hypothetical protein